MPLNLAKIIKYKIHQRFLINSIFQLNERSFCVSFECLIEFVCKLGSVLCDFSLLFWSMYWMHAIMGSKIEFNVLMLSMNTKTSIITESTLIYANNTSKTTIEYSINLYFKDELKNWIKSIKPLPLSSQSFLEIISAFIGKGMGGWEGRKRVFYRNVNRLVLKLCSLQLVLAHN